MTQTNKRNMVTVLAAGAAILAGAVVAGGRFPVVFAVFGVIWAAVAILAIISARKSRADG